MTAPQSIEILHGFIDESNESMQNIENAFIRLEKDPGNPAIIDEIFRPVHSLKGNSGFFGLTNINKFSHQMENLLDFIRNGELLITSEITDILLVGIDYLQKMLDRIYDNPEDVDLRADEEAFLIDKVDKCRPEEIKGSIQSVLELQNLLEKAAGLGIDIQENSLICNILDHIEKSNTDIEKFIAAQKTAACGSLYSSENAYFYRGVNHSGHLSSLSSVLQNLAGKIPISEKLSADFLQAVDKLQEILQDEKGIDGMMGGLRSMANFFDDDLLASSEEFYNDIVEQINNTICLFEEETCEQSDVKRVGEILVDQDKISPKQLSEALNKQTKVGDILVKDGLVKETDVQKALNIQDKQILTASRHEKTERIKTIRIDQYKLDDFANSVGELFINLDAFTFLKSRMEEAGTDLEILSRFAGTISSMDDRVARLQENIMDIRKVPVKNLFQRFPRIIRQLAASLNKEIDFTVLGENTVIDKDLLEKLENPLVHILRNSVDHGIEAPDKRADKGKKEQGNLELEAWVDEYFVHLSIRDDGGGIDPAKMKQVALKNDFMGEAELSKLSEKELINMIFRPGFSSAETVSDVSGRGVGMDVVLSSLNECNGLVDVDSILDKGTSVNIKIPLTKTLITKEALVVESAGQLFAIPSEEITTTIYIKDVDCGSIMADDRVISYNESIHKIVSANSYYYFQPDTWQKDSDQVLVVCSKHQVALLVDRMHNHQKIVVKGFPGGFQQLKDIPGISGYTILGNEDIVMIVDIEKIVGSLDADLQYSNQQFQYASGSDSLSEQVQV